MGRKGLGPSKEHDIRAAGGLVSCSRTGHNPFISRMWKLTLVPSLFCPSLLLHALFNPSALNTKGRLALSKNLPSPDFSIILKYFPIPSTHYQIKHDRPCFLHTEQHHLSAACLFSPGDHWHYAQGSESRTKQALTHMSISRDSLLMQANPKQSNGEPPFFLILFLH